MLDPYILVPYTRTERLTPSFFPLYVCTTMCQYVVLAYILLAHVGFTERHFLNEPLAQTERYSLGLINCVIFHYCTVRNIAHVPETSTTGTNVVRTA